MKLQSSDVDTLEPDFLFWQNEVLIPCLKDYYGLSEIPQISEKEYNDIFQAYTRGVKPNLVRFYKNQYRKISVLLPNYKALQFSLKLENDLRDRVVRMDDLLYKHDYDFYVISQKEFEEHKTIINNKVLLKREKFNEYTEKLEFLSIEKIVAIYIHDFELVKQTVEKQAAERKNKNK